MSSSTSHIHTTFQPDNQDPSRTGLLRVGLIGSGFMGRSHAQALQSVHGVFATGLRPELELLADIDDATAERAAAALGFKRSTGDWRALINDDRVDLVDITSPNVLHKEMALAAIAAGKPVYCEKPLAPNAADAWEMVEAAEAAGVPTMVGFNYLKNPMVALAREIITSGEIGDIVSFRGIHAEDYMSDPEAPYTWRLDPSGGHGVVADLGSHILSIARFLLGDVASVSGQLVTVHKERPVAGSNERRQVEVDDEARALLQFASGATGSIEASWVATGRKMTLAFEVTGTRGALMVDHERMNELRLHTTGQPAGREGFKTILAGPDHPNYKAFCPAPGHQLGFNEIKTIEVKALVDALAGGPAFKPDFRDAWEVQRLVDAIADSSRGRCWIDIEKVTRP